ncbi:MAG: UbiX family flavin prenyltransferase [Candidatus Altiarchaeota archaeon]|nr:UbiX family flavin prenyltransferase [Candidatus Altiarchaeota archaeon]
MRVAVGITGASGVVLGQRLVEELSKAGHEVHLVVSKGAVEVARHEESLSFAKVKKLAKRVYDEGDLAAPISSSSFKIDAMVVCPCSMKTLSAIANGYADNLISRAAENCLKMNWKLVVVPRDTPLSLPSLENMRKLKAAGGIILPPNLSFYNKPETIDDTIDFVVGKILDTLDIQHDLYKKWGGKQ